MKSPKFKPTALGSGNTAARHPPIAFRTILKCRNNSLEQAIEAAQTTHRSNDSRISVLSNTSSHIHLPIAKGARGNADQDCLSRKSGSISSKNNLKDMQKSIIATPRESQLLKDQTISSICQQNRTVVNQELRLEQLQKKIECLLRGKLQRYKLNKKGVGLTNWSYLNNDNIYSELQEIMESFKTVKETSQHDITQISARVELIEKMMASQTIEAELIRQRYHCYNSQRCNTSSHHPKPQIQIEKSPNFNHRKSQLRPQGKPGQMLAAVSNFISTNREAFSKPSKEGYINTRYKHPAYSPNRQLLPRSSYSTQFLKYGPMPTFDCRQLGLESLPAHTSLAIKTSSYQSEFKERPMNKPINIRDLDCYRDKFQNPNISFMNHCKKQMIDASSNLKKTASSKIQPKIIGSKLSKLLSQTTFNEFYKSQQRRNYHGHSEAQTEQLEWMRGSPKNSHLKEITANMRQSFLRG